MWTEIWGFILKMHQKNRNWTVKRTQYRRNPINQLFALTFYYHVFINVFVCLLFQCLSWLHSCFFSITKQFLIFFLEKYYCFVFSAFLKCNCIRTCHIFQSHTQNHNNSGQITIIHKNAYSVFSHVKCITHAEALSIFSFNLAMRKLSPQSSKSFPRSSNSFN